MCSVVVALKRTTFKNTNSILFDHGHFHVIQNENKMKNRKIDFQLNSNYATMSRAKYSLMIMLHTLTTRHIIAIHNCQRLDWNRSFDLNSHCLQTISGYLCCCCCRWEITEIHHSNEWVYSVHWCSHWNVYDVQRLSQWCHWSFQSKHFIMFPYMELERKSHETTKSIFVTIQYAHLHTNQIELAQRIHSNLNSSSVKLPKNLFALIRYSYWSNWSGIEWNNRQKTTETMIW